MNQIPFRPVSEADTGATDQVTESEECAIQTLLRLAATIEDAKLVVEHPELARLMADQRDRKAA